MIASVFRSHLEELVFLIILAVVGGIAGGMVALWWARDRSLTELERDVDRLLHRERAEAEEEAQDEHDRP